MSTLLKNFNIIDFVYSNPDAQTIDQNNPTTIYWRYIICTGMGLCIIPVVYQRNLGTLRYFSMLILIAIVYTVMVALFEFPAYYAAYHANPDYSVEWTFKPFEMRWFQGWATMMLAFNCQVIFFYVRGEMMHKTERRMNRLIAFLLSALIFFFTIISVTGYVSLGDKFVPKLYTLRRKITPESTDYMMQIAQILFTIAAYVKVSLVLFPAREQIYIYYGLDRSARNHFIITTILTLLAFSIPMIYPDVTNLLGLIGGITIGTAGYSLPVTLKIASLLRAGKKGLSLVIFCLVLVLIVGVQVSSVYVSLTSSSGGGGH